MKNGDFPKLCWKIQAIPKNINENPIKVYGKKCMCFDCLFGGSTWSTIHMTNVCVLLASTFSPTPSHTQKSSHIIQFQFVRNAPHCNMIFTYESKNQFVIKADILPKTSYIHLPKPVGNPKTMFYI